MRFNKPSPLAVSKHSKWETDRWDVHRVEPETQDCRRQGLWAGAVAHRTELPAGHAPRLKKEFTTCCLALLWASVFPPTTRRRSCEVAAKGPACSDLQFMVSVRAAPTTCQTLC